MTETALDVITKALKRLGAISGIETPSADLAQDGLDRLNGLIETWSTESLTLWTQERVTATLVTPSSVVTIGPGGNINMDTRPPWIDSITWVLPGMTDTEYGLSSMTYQQWQAESAKLLTSTQPSQYYYSPDWPLGRLYLQPGLSSSGTITLYVPIPLTEPVTLFTTLSFPSGYSRALRDWLAIELAPELGRPVDGALMQSATDAKAQLSRTNFRARELGLPSGLSGCSGAYNWVTDEHL